MKQQRFTESLSFRLSLFVAVIVLTGVCLVASFFILEDFQKTVEFEQNKLGNTATAFAAASSEPMQSNDQAALFKVLRGISEIENSTFVAARDMNGRSVAEMGGGVALSGRDGDIENRTLWSAIWANSLTAEAPIWSGGQQVGSLKLQADISWLRNEYQLRLSLMILAALGSALVIAAVSNWVIRRALKPLNRISTALVSMGVDPDLSKRFEYDREDEVGVLANAFNNAFATIQERDTDIRQHRDTLEATVQERTSELVIAADEARKANAAKSDFLATMSHEIRTPMNGMLVMAELLSASDLNTRQQRFAEVITRSGGSLLHIINDILDMSKVEAGKLELEQVPFCLSTLIEDTVSLYAARAHEKNLRIGMILSPDIADNYVGDPTRLGQIISNLTNNALKFTDEGGVIIGVTMQPVQDDHQTVCISVADTGIGIAEEKLGSIFEAFSQADQSTTRQYGGTGLGLSISKRFTEAMGGEISASSQEGQGTTFSITINFPVHAQSGTSETPERGFNIGVADASDIIECCTIKSLCLAGLNGFPLANTNQHPAPDVLMIGAVNLAEAKNQHPETPIILMTDYGESGAASTDLENVVASINSPLGMSDLQKLVSALNQSDWSLVDAGQEKRSASHSFGDYSHLNVLAVDDNAVNREVLNEALSVLSVKAVFASSGQEAVDLAKGNVFDIVFMDCSMPGMDGYQATAAIRDNTQSTDAYIVALTAHVTGEAAEKWRSAGMDNYIAKPFTVSQLDSVLSQLVADHPVAPPIEQSTIDHKIEEAALLSKEAMSMFDMVEATTGTEMKTKVFTMFCEQVDESVTQVMDCCTQRQDSKQLKELTHALKSMASSAGALRVQLWCEDVELNAEQDIWPEEQARHELLKQVSLTKRAMQESVAPSGSSPSTGAAQTADA